MLDFLLRTIFHPVFWFSLVLFSALKLVFFGNPELIHLLVYVFSLSIWAFNLNTYYKMKQLEKEVSIQRNLKQENTEKFFREVFMKEVVDTRIKTRTYFKEKYRDTCYVFWAMSCLYKEEQELFYKRLS